MPRGPLLTCALAALVACLALAPASALASQADVATTSAYLQANYAFVQSASARIGQFESKLRSLQHQIGQECPAAAANSPENTDSEQLSNEVIGTMVLTASRVDVAAAHVFVRAVRGLRWSSAALTRTIRGYASQVSRFAALAVPKLCSDIRSWTASAFQSLPASTIPFDQAFLSSWVAPGDLPSGLASYETGAERPLLARTAHLENEVTELEAREVSTWGNIMNELNLLP
jgi:hypothetical protein